MPFPTRVVLDLSQLIWRPSSFTLIAVKHSAVWIHHSWYSNVLAITKKWIMLMTCFGDNNLQWVAGASPCPQGQDAGPGMQQGLHDPRVAWLVVRAVPAQLSLLLPNCKTCMQVPRAHLVLTQQMHQGHIKYTWLFSLFCDSSGPLFSVSSMCPFMAWNQSPVVLNN